MKIRIIKDILSISPGASFLPLMDMSLEELSEMVDELVRKRVKAILKGSAR